MSKSSSWRRRAGFILAAGVAAGSVYALGPSGATASSHREAPYIATDPTVDNTDVYAFRSPDDPNSVTLIGNWVPFEEPNGGPNFYPFATDARYNMFVDNDGNGEPDVTLRFTFKNIDKRGNNTFLYNNGPVTSLTDENLLFRQTVTMETSVDGQRWSTRIKDAPVAPSLVGPASIPDYRPLRDAAITTRDGWKLYAGQADDPFFLDLRVFDLLYGGNLGEVGQDTVKGYNVNTIAVQVPMKELALNGDPKRNPVIGVWMTTERLKDRELRRDGTIKQSGGDDSDDWVQVSRLGNPLVNEVINPAGQKDRFNATPPRRDDDIPGFFDRIRRPEVPALVEAIYGLKAPMTPRDDLTEIFLTGITTKFGGPIKVDLNSQANNQDAKVDRFDKSEMLRLNMSVPVTAKPNRLGVLLGDAQGFPNGRRLTDDVLDIELQALEGAAQTGKLVDALAAGDKVDQNNVPFEARFPYVALPNKVAVNTQSAASVSTGSMMASAGGVALLAGTAVLALWWRRHRRTKATPVALTDN